MSATGKTAPEALFRCEHYSRGAGSARLSFRACIERQFKRIKVPRGKEHRAFARFEHCAAECEQGRKIAARFPELTQGRERPRPWVAHPPGAHMTLTRPVNIPSSADQDRSVVTFGEAQERLASWDAARSEELWKLIRETVCCVCGKRLGDGRLPGDACGGKGCQREKARRERAARTGTVAARPDIGPA